MGSRTGTIPENPGGEYPWALKPGKVQDPSGWGAGNRMGAPWLLPLTPRGHLEVHEAYANVSHGVQRTGTKARPTALVLLKGCTCGLQEAASRPCTVAMATAVLGS